MGVVVEVPRARGAVPRRFVRGLCRLAALAVLVVVAARAVGGEQKTPLVELALLVPFTVVVTLVAALVAVAVRARWTALLLAALLAVQIVWLAPALGVGVQAAPPERPGAAEVRVLTVNTLTGQADTAAIMAAVRECRVDLLVTIEITPTMQFQLEKAGLFAELPHRIGRSAWGAQGTMLWSRWPVEPVGDPVGELTGTEYGQPRGVVRLPSGRPVTVTAVHTLSPIPGRVQRWRVDMAALERGLTEVDGPQIAVGDFNASRDHRPFRRLLGDEADLVDAAEVVGVAGGAWPGFTWPANKYWLPPVIRLDHVLVSPQAFGVRSVDTLRVSGTDHLAVLAVLTG